MPTVRAHARVWLFDLDNTLHNASAASFPGIDGAMTDYIERELGLPRPEASALRAHYLRRYGATLLGLVRHHGIRAAHFLHDTHRLPALEAEVHGHPHDFAALDRLPGRKYILTNAPRAYAERVLRALGAARHFDGVLAIEDMAMFGDLRPKPDARMLRWIAARLKVPPARCVLVEDTLVHQKAARRVGMATVWMQRWVRRAAKHVTHGSKVGVYLHRKPVYVCARINSLQALCAMRLP
ncbi:MAG TPA: pyrimidine 5'-nucleotidase [Burkholderiaceae bacterium]|nr:pyrimidine 5'-nucleotidase [Burkholderiaceae bacterium]